MASAITLTFGTGECLRLPLSNGAMSALVASLVWVGSEVIDDDPWATDVLRLLASHDIAAIGSLPILELGRLGFDEVRVTQPFDAYACPLSSSPT